MKKLLSIILTLLMLSSTLTGCGNKKNDDPASQENAVSGNQSEPPREVAKTEKHVASENFAGGSGTEADPFQISEAGHLVLLHEKLKKAESESSFDDTYVKGHYVLTADISLNDTSDFENWSTKAPKYGWEPIGSGLSLKEFAGVFDGNGHKISGMFIDANSNGENDSYGLFSKAMGTIKNLNIEKSYICISGGGMCSIGTIAGYIYDEETTIENCNVDSEIRLYKSCTAGGIIGSGGSTKITDCSFSGSITQLDSTSNYIGGICGSNGSLTGNGGGITNCEFSGTISSMGTCGGIVGSGDNVKNSVNKGTISSDRAGGIIGILITVGTDLEIKNPQLYVEGCVNEGTVEGTTLAGGIIAQMTVDESDISTSVLNCENKGKVVCDESVSGIIGALNVERTSALKVENCTNHTDISGKGKTGGIICDLLGGIINQKGNVSISNCKNLGKIISEDQNSAGVITYFMIMGSELDFSLTVDNCSNEGEIKSTKFAGGIIGFSNVSFNAEVSAENINISDSTKITLNNCNNSGNVTTTMSNSMAGGIVGVLGLGYIKSEINNCINSGNVSIDFTLTEEQIAESQGSSWSEFYQIGGGIVGRIGDALKLTTGEGVETNDSNINTPDGNIKISNCQNTGNITAPDYSQILNSQGKPLYANYLGGIVGQSGATNGYAFGVFNCTYSGADRGFGNTKYPDFGTKN